MACVLTKRLHRDGDLCFLAGSSAPGRPLAEHCGMLTANVVNDLDLDPRRVRAGVISRCCRRHNVRCTPSEPPRLG